MGIPAEPPLDGVRARYGSRGVGAASGRRKNEKGGGQRGAAAIRVWIAKLSTVREYSLHSPQGCRLFHKSFAISSAQRSLAKISLSAETQPTRSAKCFRLRERQGQRDLCSVQMGMGLPSAERWTVHLMLSIWEHGQHSTLEQQNDPQAWG